MDGNPPKKSVNSGFFALRILYIVDSNSIFFHFKSLVAEKFAILAIHTVNYMN